MKKCARAWVLLALMLASLGGSCLLTACSQGETKATENKSTQSEMIEVERDTTPIPAGDELVQALAADSMVLLKNENSCLPLAKGTKLNLFGYNATESGFLMVGGGSGGSRNEGNHVSLLKAFEDAGVEINYPLYDAYQGWDRLDLDSNASKDAPQCILSNPGGDFYTEALLQ